MMWNKEVVYMTNTIIKNISIVFSVIALLFLIGCAEEIVVTNFEECLAAGNPAMESYPRQCRHGDQTFVEEIDEPVEPPEPLVGGDSDEHGCKGSAGYEWCEATQQCQRSWEDPCPDNEVVEEPEPQEDPSDLAGTIAINHVQYLPAYKDYNGRNIMVNNVQVVKCPGCFDVEVEFERDSVKNPGSVTKAIMHVTLYGWEVDDVSARYEEI
jgi:hypothetical protein